jgi:hypothetical protein
VLNVQVVVGVNVEILITQHSKEMKGTILLNYNDNTRQVEDEEKLRFIRNILDQIGIPIQDFWANDGPLSVDQRIKLRGILTTYGIQVIDDLDGHMQVYVENELVAEWFKSTYKLKRDLQQLDPRKQLYLEMEISCWSLFEDAEQ